MDNVLINKVAIIERCLARVAEEYRGHETEIETDFTRQDSIVLNVQRACETAIDAAMHVIRVRKYGVPQQSRDAFRLLRDAGQLPEELAGRMQAMVGFRNVAVPSYQDLSMPVLRAILDSRLGDFRDFARVILTIAGEAAKDPG